MALLPMLLQSSPWMITATVLMSIALVGWRRTRATGALLIAVGGGLQIVTMLVGAWAMHAMMARHYAYTTMGLYGLFQTLGHLISSTLFIVGVALMIRRLPTAQRRA